MAGASPPHGHASRQSTTSGSPLLGRMPQRYTAKLSRAGLAGRRCLVAFVASVAKQGSGVVREDRFADWLRYAPRQSETSEILFHPPALFDPAAHVRSSEARSDTPEPAVPHSTRGERGVRGEHGNCAGGPSSAARSGLFRHGLAAAQCSAESLLSRPTIECGAFRAGRFISVTGRLVGQPVRAAGTNPTFGGRAIRDTYGNQGFASCLTRRRLSPFSRKMSCITEVR